MQHGCTKQWQENGEGGIRYRMVRVAMDFAIAVPLLAMWCTQRLTYGDNLLPFSAKIFSFLQGSAVSCALNLETNLGSRWEGVGLPRASGKSPDFPGSSPNFPGSSLATSPELLPLSNLTAIQRFAEVSQTSPEVPRTSLEVPLTSPEVNPFLLEA